MMCRFHQVVRYPLKLPLCWINLAALGETPRRNLKASFQTPFSTDRLYVKKCLGCSERIGPDELVMRAVDSVFHLRCFLCVVCGVRLQKGDQFVVKQGQLFCRPDYEKEVEMFQGYAQGRTLIIHLSKIIKSESLFSTRLPLEHVRCSLMQSNF